MSKEQIRINLDKEKTLKFLTCFVDEARRIANERKHEQNQNSK